MVSDSFEVSTFYYSHLLLLLSLPCTSSLRETYLAPCRFAYSFFVSSRSSQVCLILQYPFQVIHTTLESPNSSNVAPRAVPAGVRRRFRVGAALLQEGTVSV